jgi:hypothetical protein
MGLEISEVRGRRDLRRFVAFPMSLYRGNACFVPQLLRDEIEILSPDRNPAFEKAEARLFLAIRDGRIVGRIAGILSHAANEKWHTRNIRFGWFDTIDDLEVARGLLQAVEAWGRERGMETITGPQGFTDFDPEGMLVEGFDEVGTIATLYNHPYYPRLVEALGFTKDVDYIEFEARAPAGGIPERMARLADWSMKRNGVHLARYPSLRAARRERQQELFDLLDEAYAELYGTAPLTDRQKAYYANKYLPFVNLELLPMAVNDEGKLVGVIVAMPSLTRAFQKARGRLLPFGFLHILLALRRFKRLDFYLAGIKQEYRGRGVDLVMVLSVFRNALRHGAAVAESNPELETNRKIQAEWKFVDTRQHKRRRIYRRAIPPASA